MARLHYVKAAKTYRGTGIKKGSFYWWFKKRINGKGGPKIRCKTRPPRSAYATSSPFIGAMMDLEDELNAISYDDPEGARDQMLDIASRVRVIGEECQQTADNVSNAFPNGCPTLDQLQSRVDACETIADALDDAANELTEESTPSDVESAISGISWEYE